MKINESTASTERRETCRRRKAKRLLGLCFPFPASNYIFNTSSRGLCSTFPSTESSITRFFFSQHDKVLLGVTGNFRLFLPSFFLVVPLLGQSLQVCCRSASGSMGSNEFRHPLRGWGTMNPLESAGPCRAPLWFPSGRHRCGVQDSPGFPPGGWWGQSQVSLSSGREQGR